MGEPYTYREHLKTVVVGNSTVGKTCLLLAYTLSHFPIDVPQTNFDNYSVSLEFEGREVSMALFDSAGQEMFDRLRSLSYPSTNVFLVCFSVACRKSFNDVKAKWVPEIQHYSPGTPFILVGTKVDLRHDKPTLETCERNRTRIVSLQEGEGLAESINAAKYVETSACLMYNVKEVIEEALVVGLTPCADPELNQCCRIL
ncbi:cdc42 homolog [Galendromus occidentalis]|uniref:Cdc42 homolog n=1 Tax=Galendromus occidentalis TaxID=34638 RepID=A0AAJ6QTV2_9ACAR|nr:cdc42 homolog [Galendromus occidentalis]